MNKSALGVFCSMALLAVASAAGAAEIDPALRAMLPEKTVESGVVNVAVNPRTPPYNFYAEDNTTLIGLEQDLANEMGQRLGIKFVFAPAQSAQVAVVAVQSGRAEMGGSMGGSVEREKIVDMVEYTLEAAGIIVPEGNPNNVHKISDLCGLRAAATQGNIPQQLLDKQATLCPADKPLEVMTFPATDQLITAMRSGRVDAMMSTYGVNKYSLEHQVDIQGGRRLMLIPGARYAIGYQGFAFSKDNPKLRDAVAATLKAMLADGSYKAIFEKWGMEANLLPAITVNDAASFSDYLKLD